MLVEILCDEFKQRDSYKEEDGVWWLFPKEMLLIDLSLDGDDDECK